MKIITKILKSYHTYCWLVILIWTVFVRVYPKYIAVYDNPIDKIFAPMEWMFIWQIGVTLFGGIYLLIVMVKD